ncbi:MAG: pyridoxal phosphate-dependent aminotransferase [Pyrinomonadaceae bacterium]
MNLPVFKLEAIFEEYEHEQGMLVLGASDASPLTIQQLLELCGEAFDSRVQLAYSHVQGEPELRTAIAQNYRARGISAEEILVTIGGSEAILLAMICLVGPGKLVLCCDPAYQPLRSIPEALGASIETYPYSEDAGFRLDVDFLVERLNTEPKPDLLVLNTPHNPTGHALTESELRSITEVAKNRKIQLLVDEVFLGIAPAAHAAAPSAITLDPNAVIVGSLSKVYGLSGLRVGWLAGPTDIIRRCKQARHYTTIAPPKVTQHLAEVAVRNSAKVLGRTRDIVTHNYSVAKQWLAEHEDWLEWIEPQGGLVMLVKLRQVTNTDEFVRRLAHEQRVFLIPCSTTFGMPEGYVRLGLGTASEILVEGLDRISEFLKRRPVG